MNEGSREVLLVEGNPALQTLLADALLREGFEVRAVENAEEALASLGPEVPVVVAEVGLSGMSGIDLTRTLRERDRTAQVVLLASSADPRLVVTALREGAAGYVVKAWDGVDRVIAGVRAAQARRQQERDRRTFLRELADLNEGFLRQMVQLEKENIDLQAQISGAPDASGEGAPYRVLIVDDEQVILTVLCNVLADEGLEVESAQTAEEALRVLGGGRFDMMIADKNLPGENGLELIRKVKGLYPHIESVIITGYGSLESAIDALHAGASGYLLKPFEDINILLSKVNELRARQLARRRAHNYLQAFKSRNQAFLEQYKAIRDKLRQYLETGG